MTDTRRNIKTQTKLNLQGPRHASDEAKPSSINRDQTTRPPPGPLSCSDSAKLARAFCLDEVSMPFECFDHAA
jgi:hypothetical protein